MKLPKQGLLNTALVVLWCALVSGCGSVREQGPDRQPSPNSPQTQSPSVGTPDADEAGIGGWKLCMQLFHSKGGDPVLSFQTLHESPQNVPQLLHNLKSVADLGLLLQPSFYDEAILGRFLSGSNVTLKKQNSYIRKGDSAIEVRIRSDVFSTFDIRVRDTCSVVKSTGETGSTVLDGEISSFLDLAVISDPRITLGEVRSEFGREDQLVTGRGWDADGLMYSPFDEGSLTYQSVRRAGVEEARIKTLVNFRLKKAPVVEDSDVVVRIEMHDMQHHLLEK